MRQNENTAPKRRRNNNRPQELRALFREAFGEPANLLMVWENLARYRGPIQSDPFGKWADRWMRWEQRRAHWLQQTLAQHRSLILKAADIALSKSVAADYSIEPEDVFIDVTWLLYQHARSFMKSTQATTPKLSTRIAGLVKWHVYIKYLKPRWADYKRVADQVEAGLPLGAEAFSDEELAELRMLESGSENDA